MERHARRRSRQAQIWENQAKRPLATGTVWAVVAEDAAAQLLSALGPKTASYTMPVVGIISQRMAKTTKTVEKPLKMPKMIGLKASFMAVLSPRTDIDGPRSKRNPR